MLKMVHYVQKIGNLVHVSNMVGGYEGQHHVHTQASFKEWAKQIDPSALDTETLAKCEPCDCSLQAGEKRSGKR